MFAPGMLQVGNVGLTVTEQRNIAGVATVVRSLHCEQTTIIVQLPLTHTIRTPNKHY